MAEMPAGDARVLGVEEASQRFGVPVLRTFDYTVSKDTLRYWELVRRKRAAEVVLVLRRTNGRYLVHTKAFYPPGVYRLLSGGVKPGEDIVAATLREAWEETGLEVQIEQFLGVLCYRFSVGSQSLPFTSFVLSLDERGGSLQPNDRDEAITGFLEVALGELLALAERLEALPPDWIDWGRFRASAHRFVLEILSAHD